MNEIPDMIVQPELPHHDKMEDYRKEYEEALREIDRPGFQTAMEVLQKCQGAIPFFELGLKLGKEDPEKALELIREIKDKLEVIEKNVGQQIQPGRYPRK